MLRNETFQDQIRIGAVAPFPDSPRGSNRFPDQESAPPRRLSLLVPVAAMPAAPGQPSDAETTEAMDTAGARERPRADDFHAAGTARAILDAWRRDLDEMLAALPPGERASRFSRLEHAHAIDLAARVPEAMLPAQVTRHAAFLAHEHAVAASFAEALAGEPGLSCREWVRRNPFPPVPPPAAASAVPSGSAT